MKDYIAFIANCIIFCDEFTRQGQREIRNLIRLNIDVFSIEIHQIPPFYESVTGAHKGQFNHTTNLIIRDLVKSDFQRAQELVRDITELLSFVTCSDVVNFGYKYYSPRITSVIAQTNLSWPILKRRTGNIRSYLEGVWPQYRRLRNRRKLNVVLDYYTSSEKSGQPIEIQLIIMFVLLENLKHTFALERGYPFINGYFRNVTGRAKTFEQLLKEMLSAVGMQPNLTNIIRLRNEIIHSGISVLPFNDKYNMYIACQNLFREYFLRLLNYRGEYLLADEDLPRVM